MGPTLTLTASHRAGSFVDLVLVYDHYTGSDDRRGVIALFTRDEDDLGSLTLTDESQMISSTFADTNALLQRAVDAELMLREDHNRILSQVARLVSRGGKVLSDPHQGSYIEQTIPLTALAFPAVNPSACSSRGSQESCYWDRGTLISVFGFRFGMPQLDEVSNEDHVLLGTVVTNPIFVSPSSEVCIAPSLPSSPTCYLGDGSDYRRSDMRTPF